MIYNVIFSIFYSIFTFLVQFSFTNYSIYAQNLNWVCNNFPFIAVNSKGVVKDFYLTLKECI